MKKLIDEGSVHFHTDGSLPRVKRYLSENMTQRPKSIMSDDQRPDVNMLNKEFETPFDNPKQLSFIERIVSISDPDAIVLDFFAGSATTAHAVMKLNAEKGAELRCSQAHRVEWPRASSAGAVARGAPRDRRPRPPASPRTAARGRASGSLRADG